MDNILSVKRSSSLLKNNLKRLVDKNWFLFIFFQLFPDKLGEISHSNFRTKNSAGDNGGRIFAQSLR